jgi:hypothetical protein
MAPYVHPRRIKGAGEQLQGVGIESVSAIMKLRGTTLQAGNSRSLDCRQQSGNNFSCADRYVGFEPQRMQPVVAASAVA